MADSKNIGVTNQRLLNSLNSVVMEAENLKLNSNKETEKDLKESLKLKQGKAIKFYPGTDKVLVKLSSENKNVRCVLLHPYISSDMNISIMPQGIQEMDEEYNEISITPYNPPSCLVLDINVNDNGGEMAVIGFISSDTDTISTNGSDGEIRVTLGQTVVSITNENVNITTNGLYWNGVNQKVPVLNNVYEKTEIDKTVDEQLTVNNNVSTTLQDYGSNLTNHSTNLKDLSERINNLESNTITNDLVERIKQLENTNKTDLTFTYNINLNEQIIKGKYLIANLKDNSTVISNVSVRIILTRLSDNQNKTYPIITDNNGDASLQINLSKGEYSYQIIFDGNEKYNPKISEIIKFSVRD